MYNGEDIQFDLHSANYLSFPDASWNLDVIDLELHSFWCWMADHIHCLGVTTEKEEGPRVGALYYPSDDYRTNPFGGILQRLS